MQTGLLCVRMASSAAPPLFKKIVPYLKRAEELDKDTLHPESKVVAYYCRAYAMTVAMDVRGKDNSKEVMGFLMGLMDKLESDKKALPAESVQPEEGQRIVGEFANRIFAKGDEEDQLGVADKSTARTFYAAGNFYDVMEQFPNKDPDIEKRRKFAKWKANEILQAIKEGRTPTPGGFGEQVSMPMPSEDGTEARAGGGGGPAVPPAPGVGPLSPPATGIDVPEAPSGVPPASYPVSPPRPGGADIPAVPGYSAPPPSYSSLTSPGGFANPAMGGASLAPQPPPAVSSPVRPPAPAPKPAPAPAPIRPASVGRGPSAGSINAAVISDAKEYTYAAISALNHKETAKAIELLEKALGVLRT